MKPFREMNKTVIGAVGIGLILLALFMAFNTAKLPIVGGGQIYQAEFSEAAGLRPMDEVRVAGVKVGTVTDLELRGDRVLVKMRLKDVEFGEDSNAAIRIKTVLGRKYVALDPEGSGRMEPGSTIRMDHTTSPYDVAEAFQGLSSTINAVDTTQVEKAFNTLSDTFKDTPDEVRSSLNGLSRLSLTISSRDAALASLLQRTKDVTQTLSDRDEDLVAIMNQSNVLLQEVQRRRAVISSLLDNTQALSQQLTGLVRENRATLKPALDRLRGIVTVLNNRRDDIDKALARFAPFVRVFANNLGNGRWFDTVVQNLTGVTSFTPGQFQAGSTGQGSAQ